ncbi:MAG: ShlB/FhaC/HecB family hemolysin secretion/activation protein [Spirulinaceae cyanobacterium]
MNNDSFLTRQVAIASITWGVMTMTFIPSEVQAQVTPDPADIRPPQPEISPPPDTIPAPQPNPLDIPEVPRLPEPQAPLVNEIIVREYQFEGNTVFSDAELAALLTDYLNRPLSFIQLRNVPNVITNYYVEQGYITSGALLPAQENIGQADAAVVTIQILEGTIDEIQVQVDGKLQPGYVESRVRLATNPVLNQQRLLDGLRLLQLNPLIDSLSAELSAGIEPGTNILEIKVVEANPWDAEIAGNNGRSPSVGSFRRGTSLSNQNFLGIGDRVSFNYDNTDGSNAINASYTVPINPRNGTVSFSYGSSHSQIIDPTFERLDIETYSRYFQLSLRQPIYQTPNQEFALSFTASHSDSQSTLSDMAFALAPGADAGGRTRVTALRFGQEWTQQNANQVFAIRSQFSLGIDALNSNINSNAPDSNFFSWRGQTQWVRLLGTPTGEPALAPTLILRGDLQFGDRPLLPIEQFGIGGLGSVKGYRQDQLLTDNGIFASAEVRVPLLRVPEWNLGAQIIPFVNFASGWNSGSSETPSPNTLVSVGLGLQLIQSQNFSARLDWGVPLVSLSSSNQTWQENGIYFSVQFKPF